MNPVILLLLHSQREVLAFSARLQKPTTSTKNGCSRGASAVQRRKNGVSCSAAAHLPCDATTGALYECAEAAAFQAQAAALRQEAAALEDALLAERRALEPTKVVVPAATTTAPTLRTRSTLAGQLLSTSWELKDDGAAFACFEDNGGHVVAQAEGTWSVRDSRRGGIGVKIRLYARGRVDGRIVSTVATFDALHPDDARDARELQRTLADAVRDAEKAAARLVPLEALNFVEPPQAFWPKLNTESLASRFVQKLRTTSRRRRARRIRKLSLQSITAARRAYDKNARAAAVAERGEPAVVGGVALVVAASGNVRVDGLAPVLATTWAPSPGALLRGEAYVVDGAPAAAKKSRRRAGGRAGGVSTRLA
ncbi:unnamed protein product [Pelagomonas calceolata]|uniref:Uncharacterized protein n=1 Tax=Pelagomonas calceolata TaxID=35677 RepID=A0A7S4E871_9STRA|nr:unnamed protein product [Pelagomonas calceolata]|mmetsp:Transcript_21304/g.63577  ORF Transcript_21304/g.63577 Transcript_21304/m.63577 type:complete len:367 (+) Transcript_21304:127-1227(+)